MSDFECILSCQTNNWHLFTNRQNMRYSYSHKLFTNFSNSQISTCFFFELLLILPIRKLAIKRDTFVISNTKYKIRKLILFITSWSKVHLKSFIPRIKRVKHSAKTFSSDSKSNIHRQDTTKNLRFIQRKSGNPSTKSYSLNYLDTKLNALEPNIPYDSKVVGTELYEKFNSN